jgi:hypothetical protein
MQSKIINKIGFLFLVSLLFAAPLLAGQEKTPQKVFTPEDLRKMAKGKLSPPHEARFQIDPIESSKGMYLAFIAEESKVVREFVFYDKLSILEAIVLEAKKFGLNEEAVGGAKPLTTRFSDKQVPNFIVDVQKAGKMTQFFVTLKGQTESGQMGSLTISAGSIKRGDPDAKAMFYDIVENVQAAKQHAAAAIQ